MIHLYVCIVQVGATPATPEHPASRFPVLVVEKPYPVTPASWRAGVPPDPTHIIPSSHTTLSSRPSFKKISWEVRVQDDSHILVYNKFRPSEKFCHALQQKRSRCFTVGATGHAEKHQEKFSHLICGTGTVQRSRETALAGDRLPVLRFPTRRVMTCSVVCSVSSVELQTNRRGRPHRGLRWLHSHPLGGQTAPK